jgi:hypothetical protein
MHRWWMMGLWLGLALGVCAADHGRDGPAEAPAVAEERGLAAMQAVAGTLEAAIREVDELSAELAESTSEERGREIKARMEAERERVEQLRGSLREMLAGAENAAFDEHGAEKSTLQDQVTELLEPLIGALREPTARMRESETTRQALELWSERRRAATLVVGRIDALLARQPGEPLKRELESARRIWAGRQTEAAGQVEVLRLQVEDLESGAPTVWESISRLFSDFWKTRGLNVVLAFGMALLGFVAVRRTYRWLRRINPLRGKDKGGVMGRASDVVALVLALLTAVFAVLLVFYLRGDWLLLTLAAVLLVGAAWAGKTALPPYIDQIRMLLNLGAVREGERVVHLGLPWRVRSLGFYTIFENPELEGGELRMPLRRVMDMISRVQDPHEPWFPTRKDDWVLLDDDSFGKILRQTPEQVVLLKLGGSLKTYPAAAFLGMMPENLSRGFRVQSRFGIDYRHQPIATGEVLEVIGEALTRTLGTEFGGQALHSVKVEFQAAGESSLDLAVLVDCKGELAPRYRFISRRIQAICVDVCTERGWGIPFKQITLHQAPPAENSTE